MHSGRATERKKERERRGVMGKPRIEIALRLAVYSKQKPGMLMVGLNQKQNTFWLQSALCVQPGYLNLSRNS